jgi:hypothetical protein
MKGGTGLTAPVHEFWKSFKLMMMMMKKRTLKND